MHPAYAKKHDDVPRDELVRSSLPLVRRIAFRMARRLPPNVDVDDLIAAGCEGLVRAAQSFDPTRVTQFEAYARERIRGAILDELRVHDPMTSYGRRRLSAVSATIASLERALGRSPSEEEIASALAIDVDEYRRLAESLARGPALARLGAEPDQIEAAQDDPLTLVEAKGLRTRLADAIRKLPERSQQVLALYYQEECTQAEIALVLGVTESRVCQLLGECAARLRGALESAGDDKTIRNPSIKRAAR